MRVIEPLEHDDIFHDECAIFGVISQNDAAALTALGLHAMQHRGQEASGIVSINEGKFFLHKAHGKVGDNFGSEAIIKSLPGDAAIGHNRYSTSGSKKSHHNIQPIFAELSHGGLGIAHNGNLTNAEELKKKLVKKGSIFTTTMDTEVVMHLIATSTAKNIDDAVIDALKQCVGAYSFVMLTKDTLIGVRDPNGVRPLILGKTADGYVLTSETCALDIIAATYVRDIKAGEMVVIKRDSSEIKSVFPFEKTPQRFCIFEYVYFSRPDSFIEGRHVYDMRKQMGKQLAIESMPPADVVIPVPDSGVPAALGFAEQASLPFELGIIRNHYIGRTFIEPTDHVRHLGVKLKHNANRGVIQGKRVVLIDDSIVRGTTSNKIVSMVREAGAREVHMRISSPPTTNSCFYGVDTPAKEQLLASKMNVAEMAKFIGVDSLAFLSVDGLYRAVGELKRNSGTPQYCDACFTGDYPIPLVDNIACQK